MKIEILGPGCPKCAQTEEVIERIIRETGVEAEVQHITDIDSIVDRGVMMTPAVIVDGQIMIEGKIPSERDVRSWLS
ncbi:MAG: thioredoxin family protein [Bacillota bacterium]